MCCILLLKWIHIDSLYLVKLERLKAEIILIDQDWTGWMICEFVNVNNKQKKTVTNPIIDQIW